MRVTRWPCFHQASMSLARLSETLLCAASQVVDRVYSVVRDTDEISPANWPRIVELHGATRENVRANLLRLTVRHTRRKHGYSPDK